MLLRDGFACSACIRARGLPNHILQGLGDGGAGAWRRPPVGAAVGASGLGFGSERFDNGQPALRVQHVRLLLVWLIYRGTVIGAPLCRMYTWVCRARSICVQTFTNCHEALLANLFGTPIGCTVR